MDTFKLQRRWLCGPLWVKLLPEHAQPLVLITSPCPEDHNCIMRVPSSQNHQPQVGLTSVMGSWVAAKTAACMSHRMTSVKLHLLS